MSLMNEQELSVTREKLRMLEESYAAARQDASGSRHAQELELRSLQRLINQLREEIARFEAREAATARNGFGPRLK